MSDDRIRFVVRYSGNVQGVGFRMTTVSQSRGLPVDGFVRNQPDGSVELDVEGSDKDLRELMRRIKEAMSGNVEDVECGQRPLQGHANGLQIRH